MGYNLTKNNIDNICKETGKLSKWKDSVFESLILNYNPSERGKKAEHILSKILTDIKVDHNLITDNSLGYDFIIRDKKVELKYSSENDSCGFIFDQVRIKDGRYDFIIFMFVNPNFCEFFCIKKNDLKYFTTNNQHSGQDNASTLTSTAYNMKLFRESGDGTIEDVIEKILGFKEYKSIKLVLKKEQDAKKYKVFEIINFIFNSDIKITYKYVKDHFRNNKYFNQSDIMKITKKVKNLINNGECYESVCNIIGKEFLVNYK